MTKQDQELDSKTEEIIEEKVDIVKDDRLVKRLDKGHLEIDGVAYEVVEEKAECIDLEQLENRYTDFFEKFHYIVGDYSKDQLRLKGFYNNDQKDVPDDLKIDSVEDYLVEYCSFGCNYFILKRLEEIKNFQAYSKQSSFSNQDRKSRRSKRRGKPNKSRKKGKGKTKKRSNKSNFTKHEKTSKPKNVDKKKVKTVKNRKDKTKFTINKLQ